MNVNLLLITLIIFSCIFFNKISFRFGIPTLFVFILLGMAFGTDGFARISFDNFALSETVCSVALIFIMFYGGFCPHLEKKRGRGGGRASPYCYQRRVCF
jgi:K+:H+ antiporter